MMRFYHQHYSGYQKIWRINHSGMISIAFNMVFFSFLCLLFYTLVFVATTF